MQRASCIVPAPVGAALCAAVLPRSRWLPRFQGGSSGGYRVCWPVFAVATALTSRRLARQFERGGLCVGYLPVICRSFAERGKRAAWFRASHFAALAARQFRRVRGVERGRKRGRNSRRFTRRFCTVQRGTLRGTFAALVSRSAALCAAVFIERGKQKSERGKQRGSFAALAAWSAAENAALCFERGKQKAERGKERGTSVRARQTARRFSSSAASGLVYRHG